MGFLLFGFITFVIFISALQKTSADTAYILENAKHELEQKI